MLVCGPSKALAVSLRDSCSSVLEWLRHREDEAEVVLAELRDQAQRRTADAAPKLISAVEHSALAALGFSLTELAPPPSLCTPELRPASEVLMLRDQYERLGYVAVPDTLAPTTLAFLAAHYRALHRLSEAHGGSYKGGGYGGGAAAEGGQEGAEAGTSDAILSHNRYAIDNERLARFTADRLLPQLEQITGMKLKYALLVAAVALCSLSPLSVPHSFTCAGHPLSRSPFTRRARTYRRIAIRCNARSRCRSL